MSREKVKLEILKKWHEPDVVYAIFLIITNNWLVD